MTRKLRVGLIGHNIGYSKSGEIYTAILDRLGFECDFQLLDVSPDEIDTVVYRLRREGFIGTAVTIPHKHVMLSFLDRRDKTVTTIGATNSIAIEKSSLLGYNTDSAGFTYLAREIAGLHQARRVAVIGTGGGARAVVYSLYSDFGCRDFHVYGRLGHSLEKFEREYLMKFPDAAYRLRLLNETDENDNHFDAVINCTPLGGWHLPEHNPLPTSVTWDKTDLYVDLNYNENSRPIAEATNANIRAFNGAGMLVAQAVESVRLWTGKTVAFEPVFSEVFPDAIGSRGLNS